MRSSYAPSALEFAVRCDRVGKQVSACSRMDARASVGLPPGGPGGRLGLMSGRLASMRRGRFCRLVFFGALLQFSENIRSKLKVNVLVQPG